MDWTQSDYLFEKLSKTWQTQKAISFKVIEVKFNVQVNFSPSHTISHDRLRNIFVSNFDLQGQTVCTSS